MKQTLSFLALLAAVPAFADETRQLAAHEHGVGALNIAIDGTTVAMEFHAPGADIVGFEYAAESEKDREAVDKAVVLLAAPLDLFEFPAAAKCSVTQANAELESEDSHDDHDPDHEDHAEHEDHSEGGDHEGHEDHEHAGAHTEFHAEYTLGCAKVEALTEIHFGYFETFPNARELDVQIITGSGAQAFEVPHDAPLLDLRSLF